MIMPTALTVNGQKHEVDATPGMPLLWVLRDLVGLNGTKFGCGSGLCGACTVHLNGQAVRSCVIPVEAVADAEILTIEGLGDTSLARVQDAWVDEQVPQCGYCQPGMIMSVAAILEAEPELKPAAVRQRLNNICRCGTYDRVNAAIAKLFPEQKA
jgi:isoquinoline 1-oxidoreductase alpha subunit